ncbi:hypothetical protein ACFYYH_05870 [Streptomyces sp. NPDC002018]|uniref:hypothetical protein n=1 Tax=Streptomyces sp. NPDC002018 TaxID=3364629 RepID=UPI00368AA7DF
MPEAMPYTPPPRAPLMTVTGHTLVLARRYEPDPQPGTGRAPGREPRGRRRPRTRPYARRFAIRLGASLRALLLAATSRPRGSGHD